MARLSAIPGTGPLPEKRRLASPVGGNPYLGVTQVRRTTPWPGCIAQQSRKRQGVGNNLFRGCIRGNFLIVRVYGWVKESWKITYNPRGMIDGNQVATGGRPGSNGLGAVQAPGPGSQEPTPQTPDETRIPWPGRRCLERGEVSHGETPNLTGVLPLSDPNAPPDSLPRP